MTLLWLNNEHRPMAHLFKTGPEKKMKKLGTASVKQEIKPGDFVKFVPHSLMELRTTAVSGFVFSKIGTNWFRVHTSHENTIEIVDCPSHMLEKAADDS